MQSGIHNPDRDELMQLSRLPSEQDELFRIVLACQDSKAMEDGRLLNPVTRHPSPRTKPKHPPARPVGPEGELTCDTSHLSKPPKEKRKAEMQRHVV